MIIIGEPEPVGGVRREEHGTCLAPVPACPTLRQTQLLEIQIERLEFLGMSTDEGGEVILFGDTHDD